MKVRIFGDIHLRKEEPFFTVAKDVLDLAGKDLVKGDKLIFLGDFFHTSRPYPEEIRVAKKYFDKWETEGIDVSILAGNHEYHAGRDTYAEQLFEEHEVHFFDKVHLESVESLDCSFLFLPWISKARLLSMGYNSMKEYYESDFLSSLSEGFLGKTVFLLYHFEDESTFTGLEKTGVDLSILEDRLSDIGVSSVRIGGHIHLGDKNYLGTPYATRKDESGGTFRYFEISDDGCEYVSLPTLLAYKEVEYDNLSSTRFLPSVSYLLTIKNAPSSDSVFEYVKGRKNLFVEDYTLRFNEDRTITSDDKEEKASIREYLELFLKQNKVDTDTTNYILEVFAG